MTASNKTQNASDKMFAFIATNVALGSEPEHKDYAAWQALRFEGHRIVVSKTPQRVTVDLGIAGKKTADIMKDLEAAGIPADRLRQGGTGNLCRVLNFSEADWTKVAPLLGVPQEMDEEEVQDLEA